MAGVLTGLRVIDFGQYIAGPLTAMMLADQGADVARVDPRTGPRMATPANATWNRGKRSIALDLSDEADRAIARKLVASADVVIENFRPGVMDRLGLVLQQDALVPLPTGRSDPGTRTILLRHANYRQEIDEARVRIPALS